VVDDRDRGLWWMMTFHMGSTGPRRAFVQHHSLDIAIARANQTTIAAHIRIMADTGAARARCAGSRSPVIPGSGPEDETAKDVPVSNCSDIYERWPVIAEIAGLGKIEMTSVTQNPAGVLKQLPDGSYSQTDLVLSNALTCPNADPYNPLNDCKFTGDRRKIDAARIVLKNTANTDKLWTDAFGNPTQPGVGVCQLLDPRLDIAQSGGVNFANGIDNGDVMIYRASQYCARNNCDPLPFTDGTVRPPN
jgi:hypothetical protein